MSTELYDKNMAALKEIQPDLHKWILSQPDMDWLRADGNQLHMTVGTVSYPIYDVEDPLKELSNIDQLPLYKENVTVFVGLGLGHTVNRVCTRMEKFEGPVKNRQPNKMHHVVVVEPVGHVYRMAFERYDFSKHIRSRALWFAPGRGEVDFVLGLLEAAKVVTDWLVLADKTSMNRHEYKKLADYTMEILNQIQCNQGTVTSAGAKIADNDVATLPWVIRHRGVAELIGLFAGKPCVCVSTGPSLARNIHVLKEIQGRVVIVAVGQALRPLLAYDIRPDFICTVDFGEVNATHYAGLCDEDVPLVTINKTYAPLLKAYKGPKFISAGAVSVETTHSVLKDMGELPQGGSVAHMAFGLAANLGCSPIIMMGQDFALTDASHFGQADSMGKVEVIEGMIKWKIDDPRSPTLHDRDDISMGPAVYVPGWWGEQVLTNTGLMTFITAMQRLVEQCPVPIINCTEGGCHIEGTRRMFLADAADKYCIETIDKSVIMPLLSLHPDADKRIEAALPLLHKDMKTLEAIIDNSEKGLATIAELRETHTPKKITRLLFDNRRYSEAANRDASSLPPVNTAIFGARRRIESRKLNVKQDHDHLIANRKDLITRLERNEVILMAARDASRELMKSYKACEMAFMAYAIDKTALDSTGETTPADVSDADHYFNTGNFAKPLLEAQRILRYELPENGLAAEAIKDSIRKETAHDIVQRAYKIRYDKVEAAKAEQKKDREDKTNLIPQYLDLIDSSRKRGRDDKNMDAALTDLRAAIELLPDRMEARWGLASALLHAERYAEAVHAYEELVMRFPDKHRFLFEQGQVLILAGRAQEGLVKIRAAMEKTDEFDHFLGALGKLYAEFGLIEAARAACELHLKQYPNDIGAQEVLDGLDKGPMTTSEV